MEVNSYYNNNEPYNSNKLIINNDMLLFMNKLFNKADDKREEFNKYFMNPDLEDFNKRKKYTNKNNKYNIDDYNLLIRENEYNNKKSIYGWVLCDGKPININITEELKTTKSKDEIFNILMSNFVNKKKIHISKNTIAGQIYNCLNIDVSKYMK